MHQQQPAGGGPSSFTRAGFIPASATAGYCVTRVLFDRGRPYGELVYVNFLTGDGKVLGRPVDVVVGPRGSLLISDDEGGRIYRLRFRGQ